MQWLVHTNPQRVQTVAYTLSPGRVSEALCELKLQTYMQNPFSTSQQMVGGLLNKPCPNPLEGGAERRQGKITLWGPRVRPRGPHTT
jgi:hypothetical protein